MSSEESWLGLRVVDGRGKFRAGGILRSSTRAKMALAAGDLRAIIIHTAILNGVLAQLVERLNGIEEVRGSNPLGSTNFWWSFAKRKIRTLVRLPCAIAHRCGEANFVEPDARRDNPLGSTNFWWSFAKRKIRTLVRLPCAIAHRSGEANFVEPDARRDNPLGSTNFWWSFAKRKIRTLRDPRRILAVAATVSIEANPSLSTINSQPSSISPTTLRDSASLRRSQFRRARR